MLKDKRNKHGGIIIRKGDVVWAENGNPTGNDDPKGHWRNMCSHADKNSESEVDVSELSSASAPSGLKGNDSFS